MAIKPTKPGFYWARWLTATEHTHEGCELTPAPNWEVVEVWENDSQGASYLVKAIPLGHPTAMEAITIWKGRWLVVKEVD